MQDHLKERITGAAILVVVVVLLVPEMFRGPPPAKLKSGTGAAAGPPVRSYTIDLRDSGTASPAASAPEIATSAPAAETAPASGPASAPPAPAVPPPAHAASSVPAPAAAQPAAPVPAAPVTAQQGGAGKSGWTVQVGSFARRDYADRMVKQLAAKGFTLEVAGPDNRGLYRVRSAPLSQHAAALALKQKMQANGLKPIINTAP